MMRKALWIAAATLAVLTAVALLLPGRAGAVEVPPAPYRWHPPVTVVHQPPAHRPTGGAPYRWHPPVTVVHQPPAVRAWGC